MSQNLETNIYCEQQLHDQLPLKSKLAISF